MKEIKIFRLLSTEQIMGFFLSETDKTISVDYPLEIIIESYNDSDKHELSGIKWSPFSDDSTITLNKSSIVSISHSPKRELIEYYKNKINKLYLLDTHPSLDEESDYYQSVLDSFDDDTEH
jgi:hypothetical protein